MRKHIGKNFGNEVHAAGLGGLPFSWTEELIGCADSLGKCVTITCEVGASAVDVREGDGGGQIPLTEPEIISVKQLLTDHVAAD